MARTGATSRKGPGMDRLLAAHKVLSKTKVLVGIPAAAGEQVSPDGTHAINLATLGYIMENGSPAKNIPARPFLTPGIADAKPDIVAQMKKGGIAVLQADPQSMTTIADATLDKVALVAVSAVKRKITSNIPPALQDSTIAARQRRGVTRTNTLVDQGVLLNSITYVKRGTNGG